VAALGAAVFIGAGFAAAALLFCFAAMGNTLFVRPVRESPQ
jgi:hypothetical protein